MSKFKEIRVTICRDEPGRTDSICALDQELQEIESQDFAEVWVDHSSYPSLCILVNGQNAWLMVIRYNGDAGFSSRNPEFQGNNDLTIDYYLSNDQHDRYPASWAYPTKKVFGAIQSFAREQRMPDWIQWHNDSEDGTLSPNAPFKERDN